MNARHLSHPLLIIGSGPAGYTAGIYAARAKLNPLIVEGKTPGGQLMGTTLVENWPGTSSIFGPQLMIQMKEHAQHCGATTIDEMIERVDFTQYPLQAWTTTGTHITAHAVIIATGATPKRLHCPGEEPYWGRGVTTCAVCDGSLYYNKRVLIVGGGDTAMEDASFMTKFTDQITIIHIRQELSASPIMQERVLGNPHINIVYNATVTEIHGDQRTVTGATIARNNSPHAELLPVDGIFLAIGLKPNSVLFSNQIACDARGYILTHRNTETSIRGVFAAGDVVDARYRQAITSAGEGCKAALDAERFLHTQ